MVIWLVGLSGAGKTTIAKSVYAELKQRYANTVLLDGDEIRAIFKHDGSRQAYTLEGRKQNASRMQAICQWLDAQHIHVVCSILCVFPEFYQQNRALFSHYFEILVDVPLVQLITRDDKGLYQAHLRGDMPDVVGMDLPYIPPSEPDLVINNDFAADSLVDYTQRILTLVGEHRDGI